VFVEKKTFLFVLVLSLVACQPQSGEVTPVLVSPRQTVDLITTPLPTRPDFDPGQLVDYVAQTGDTLQSLSARFNTTSQQIRGANPEIPLDATTMPPGMPMKIPIYYLPFWGTTFQILPDSQYVNGPATIGFDTSTYVATHSGWLKDYHTYAVEANHSGAEIVDIVASNYSLSPRVLLAVLEYQTGALSQPVPPNGIYPLGEIDYTHAGLYMQLVWAADVLNNGYYGWRTGNLTALEHLDGNIERPDPWQTAATVAFQYYYSQHSSSEEYTRAIGPDGLAKTYQSLFGNPWVVEEGHIPVSLQQPELTFPFPAGDTWAFTSGPHSGWGSLQPWAALDFGPPDVKGCSSSAEMVTAMANGVVVRSETGVVVLDLNGDGDERTGWDILYLHVASNSRAQVGQEMKVGDPIGYPSCEGGTSTGTHIHIARKYNGEWIPADGAIPFNLDGWIAHGGNLPRQGILTRGNKTVIACECSDAASQIQAGK
jgi:LasA protease